MTGSLPVRRPGPGEVPDPTLTPIAIRRVEDSTGHVIDHNKPQRVQAVSRESALQAIAMLRSVVRVGTARRIASFPRPAAGKTGTTEDFVDAWFVGMTPTLTTAVWNGFPTIRVPMLKQFHGGPGLRRHVPGAALEGVHAGRRSRARRCTTGPRRRRSRAPRSGSTRRRASAPAPTALARAWS